ncbi:MAG: hypothetical protein HZA90_10250 [Verrucomicrobia bacterium]|nr:hypothetical protein [Verrucomicrobiota bacterium]
MSDIGGLPFSLADVYHTLFRQKYKIAVITGLAFVVSVYYYFTTPAVYVSEAKEMIRGIVDRKDPASTPGSPESQEIRVANPDTIINTEIEILTSRDLTEQVAEVVGPEKILGKVGAKATRVAAGAAIMEGIEVEIPRRSSVLKITFRHPNPEIAQKVLQQLVLAYKQRHKEVHLASSLREELYQQNTETYRTKLQATKEELRRLKDQHGLLPLEDSKNAFWDELARLQQERTRAETELAECGVIIPQAQSLVSGGNTNSATNVPVVPVTTLSQEQVSRASTYQSLAKLLNDLESRELNLVSRYTDEHPELKGVRTQIAEVKKKKEDMRRETPSLEAAALPTAASDRASGPGQDYGPGRIAALKNKIEFLDTKIESLRKEAARVSETASTYAQLMYQKEVEEKALEYYSKALELARIDQLGSPGKASSVSELQTASPPMKENSGRLKVVMGILLGGFFGSLVLAFLIENFFDQSVKRPIEIERKLKIPLLLWIPEIRRNGAMKRAKPAPPAPDIRLRRSKVKPSDAKPDEPTGTPEPDPLPPMRVSKVEASQGELAPWHPEHALRNYYEALRDRLVTYFEVRNMTHKPKLVAVTGCSAGTGVSSIATGLAAVLSETGDGNVLLVDMNYDQGAAHRFHKGKPCRSLAEALDNENAADTEQNKLYFVAGGSSDEKLPRILPKAFTHLVPRMKASDYDFIIFDMPPVGQTTATARIARHMDMTLLVIEAEKDHLDAVRRAAAALQESKANVGALLNRKRTYVPDKLLPDI